MATTDPAKRRKHALAYYYRHHEANKAKARLRAEQRRKQRGLPTRAETGRARRKMFRKRDPLYKLLANLPPIRLTSEERIARHSEATRAYSERKRRESGALPRAERTRIQREERAQRAATAPKRMLKVSPKRVQVVRHRTQDVPSSVRSAYKRGGPGSQLHRLYPTYDHLVRAARDGKFDQFRTERQDLSVPG